MTENQTEKKGKTEILKGDKSESEHSIATRYLWKKNAESNQK